MYMPIIRKIVQVGTSRAVIIPKSWLQFYEKQTGQPVTEVAVEVNKILKIKPILNNKKRR